ncbi:secretion protein snm4 [Cellulomonas flavigena DSM 20109]|uniref:Secretion protein snm4 n=1 Tax=Cellulomonas flavigena (strain ATCC 482 / DSM 20109 / BCRC 11376 / JCM 18109 / NBRC 3775 / NCIMB 8073 / NRS 134) TaxID=446466 RepID=D5UIA0_CELFN|nr:hypothetical protein [Cellulomonas flavigena]ADG75445.1 secretion protein snm4 [Cellulomonas flavigena DSM 20109]
MTGARPASPAVRVLDLLLCWTGGLVGYLVGEYGAGAVLAATIGDGGVAAVPSWTWLPWLAGPVLCGLLAGSVLALLRVRTPWWTWLLAGGFVPLAASPVTGLVTAGAVDLGDLALAVAVQVLVACVAAAAVGAVARVVGRRAPAPRPAPPASYSS